MLYFTSQELRKLRFSVYRKTHMVYWRKFECPVKVPVVKNGEVCLSRLLESYWTPQFSEKKKKATFVHLVIKCSSFVGFEQVSTLDFA